MQRKSRQIKHKLVIVLDVLKPAIVFQCNSAQGKPINFGHLKTPRAKCVVDREPYSQEQG